MNSSLVRPVLDRKSSVLIQTLKRRVVDATSDLFARGPRPLADTLSYPGDPGLLGPGSVSWRVIGDASVLVGGIRALLVQTAHPEVVAGVEQHSQYRSDPLGRLSRTAAYVTETTYGAMPEVDAAVGAVQRAHAPVRGRSERGKSYSAGHSEMAAWVHNVLTDSFLVAYQTYGPRQLTAEEADRFVDEQTRIGTLLGAAPLPTTAEGLRRWIDEHRAIAPSRSQERSIEFLRDPPLSLPVKAGYRLLFAAAVATLPSAMADLPGLTTPPAAEEVGRLSLNLLRWALGSSPAWHLALVRCGAPVPDGLFRQPPRRDRRRDDLGYIERSAEDSLRSQDGLKPRSNASGRTGRHGSTPRVAMTPGVGPDARAPRASRSSRRNAPPAAASKGRTTGSRNPPRHASTGQRQGAGVIDEARRVAQLW
jgi:uncharacterized protein (DUF2236 family)